MYFAYKWCINEFLNLIETSLQQPPLYNGQWTSPGSPLWRSSAIFETVSSKIAQLVQVFMFFLCVIHSQVKALEEEVTLVGNNLRSLEVSEGEVSWELPSTTCIDWGKYWILKGHSWGFYCFFGQNGAKIMTQYLRS